MIVAVNTLPVIALNGQSQITIVQGQSYNEQGATASDAEDGSLSVTITGNVNTNVAGSYTVTYSATDSHGANASVTRTVNVTTPPDTTSPVITLTGSNPVEITQGDTYNDAGATATDNVDGNLTANIITTNPVDTNTIGAYTVRYNVSDAAGNAATEVTRTVNVVAPVDTTVPVITLSGSNPVEVTQGDTYNDAGATASDNVDGNLTANIVTTNPVNTAIVGAYTVRYNVSDAAGNAATEVTRTVNVVQQAVASMPPLNDTGITWGGNYPNGNNLDCTGETISEQDCSFGRDAEALAGTLTKVGGGNAGFDFTKLGADGSVLAI